MKHFSAQQPSQAPDLTSCDREAIQFLGNVQSFGCLLAVSQDWMVTHASENAETFLGLRAIDMIGTSFAQHFLENTSHKLRGKTQSLTTPDAVARAFGFDVFETGRLFDISVHQSGEGYIFEFEEKASDVNVVRDDLSLVQPLISRVRGQPTLTGMATEAARSVRALTGFDRVMVYQFAEDGTGCVIAEACAPSMERYLGLRYPASDIPKQARQLYTRNHIRLIADVNSDVSPILPEKNPVGDALDLSISTCRAVSPTHLEYLRNMGVGASMSASIMRRGKLWGLIACHNRTPMHVDYEMRTTVELFTQLFSYELSEKLQDTEQEETENGRQLHDRIMSRLSNGKSLAKDFEAVAEEIWDAITFDGIVFYSDGEFRALGQTPSETEFLPLVRFLNTTSGNSVFSTDHLAGCYDRAADLADRVAGIMVLPISRHPRDYIVLFRNELARIVRWAGSPEKVVEQVEGSTRLSPRKSFQAWREVVNGKSSPWTISEVKAAEALRITLLEVVLRVTDKARQDRTRAQQKQELLVAELNHRVRNILNIIGGVVSQGRSCHQSIADFTAVLDGRIQSLARAHDQLTQDHWEPASLKQLIAVELEAYNDTTASRALFEGVDVLLKPDALTTLALVVHELSTNSAKYGALSEPGGSVTISLDQKQDGSVCLSWRERGGPPVQAPQRHGFGTSIIENSIPFELKGQVDIRYRMTGLEVDMTIPEKYCVAQTETHQAEPSKREVSQPQMQSNLLTTDPAAAPKSAGKVLAGDVLLVEDNHIIAMDTQDKLTELGARDVHIANCVSTALDVLNTEAIEFAVLDVNLGQETSAKVAHQLHGMDIPFILATGYGANSDIEDAYPKSRILKKPYMLNSLRNEIDATFEDVRGETPPLD